jgi:hypothetical protein
VRGRGPFLFLERRESMTDDQVLKLIMKELKKRDITFYDMIGTPDHGVDPDPEDKATPACEKGIRNNRFEAMLGTGRMKELLCVGKFNEWDDYPPLKVPFQDLFRFWWNRCVVKEYVLDDVLGDIYDFLIELLRPPREKEEEEMDLTLDFDQIPLFAPSLKKAA